MRDLRWALIAAVFSSAAWAHDFRAGEIVVDHPYALAAGGSVYFRTLRNTGHQPDRLLGGSSPAAERVELLHDGRPETLPLAAGAEVNVRHDGPWQLALRGLKAPLKVGDTVRVTLRFEHAGEATVPVAVVDVAGRHAH